MQTRKFAVVGFILLLVLAGCGTREPSVAKVGREKITLKEFKDGFVQRFRGEDAAARKSYQDREQFVRELAVTLAKYQEGIARGIDKRPEVAEQLEQVGRRKALDLLYQDEVINKVINDQTARDFYDRSGVEVKARHILLKTSPVDTVQIDTIRVKARIDSIHRAIKGGLTFKAAAKMFSEDAASAADSGDLGWFQWGRMVEEFQTAVWKANPGQVTEPIRTNYGYHLVMVEEKRNVEKRPSFEESKDQIKSQLREVESQRLMERARTYVEDLRSKGKLVYNEANLDVFRKRLLDPTVSKVQGLEPVFSEDQKKLEVAAYKDGKVTVADLIAKVGANAGRVDWNDKKATTDLVNAIVEPKLLEKDAEAKGLYRKALKDPDVEAERRQAVVRLLEKEEITDKVNPTPADEQRYYETHLANFVQPELRTIREIFIKEDSLKAVKIRDRARKGENFEKLAKQFNEKESTKPENGKLGPFEQKRFGLIGKTAFMLAKVGEVSDVVPAGKNYSVIQLMEVIPSRTKSFEEAAVDAKRQARQAMTEEKQKELEKTLSEKYKLDIDAKALAAVWPVAEGAKEGEGKVTREA